MGETRKGKTTRENSVEKDMVKGKSPQQRAKDSARVCASALPRQQQAARRQ